jgi:6-phosphofructokinase 1
MDWDLSFADATFGFRTAVDHAVECIRTAHWEAESQNRIAVVELFGAGSGFVALHAGFLSGVADVILIPELPHPEEAVFRHIQRRLEKRDHACVVLAEGALEEFRHGNRAVKARAFASFLERLRQRFPHRDFVDIRPRYLIRGTPPNSFDLDLAKYSGYLMADAALSGYTNCSVQWWQGNYVLVPLPTAVAHLGQVPLWMPYFWYMAQRYLLPEASGDGATGAS